MADTEDLRVSVATIRERVGSLDDKISAAHKRMDKFETTIRDEYREIRSELKTIAEELKPVHAYINRGKGWAAAGMFLAGLFGGVIVAGIVFLMKHSA